MASYKTMEEIRAGTDMSQSAYAGRLGISRRTYTDRLNGSEPKWTIEELIEAAKMNAGKVKVQYKGTTYNLDIIEEA